MSSLKVKLHLVFVPSTEAPYSLVSEERQIALGGDHRTEPLRANALS